MPLSGLVHLTINKLPSALSSHLSAAPTASTRACLPFPLAGSTKECRKWCKMAGRENHLSVLQELPGFHFKPWRFPGLRRACPELHPYSAAEEFPNGWGVFTLFLVLWSPGDGDNGESRPFGRLALGVLFQTVTLATGCVSALSSALSAVLSLV